MAGFWDWLTVPPADQQYYQPGNYRLPQVDIGMTRGAAPPPMPGPINPNLMQAPPVAPQFASEVPSNGFPDVMPDAGPGAALKSLIVNPIEAAKKAAAAGIRPPTPEQAAAATGGAAQPAIDWTATLGAGTSSEGMPMGAKDGANKTFGEGLKALAPQESASAPRPSGSANASVGPADLSFSGNTDQVIQSILALLAPQKMQEATTMRGMGLK